MNEQREEETQVEAEKIYSSSEIEHAKLMERMAVMCRSNAESFTVTDRLEVIENELKDTPYKETRGSLCSIWSKVPLSELPKDVILISSHADTVPSISKCSSTLREDGFYSGTYDNIGTNTAAVILMKEHKLPDNVVIAFTGEEESCSCAGAKQAANMLLKEGCRPLCIALDVTYEGFDNSMLFSLENLTEGMYGKEFLDKIMEAAIGNEPEGYQTFCFVRAGDRHVPDILGTDNMLTELGKKYMEPCSGMYDEAFAYRDAGHPAMSICLPCEGSMHSNAGVLVKQPVFEGYVLSLASMVYALTQSMPERIEEYKTKRQELSIKAGEILKPEVSYYNGSYVPFPTGSFHNYYFDDDDYEEDEEDYDYEEIIDTELECILFPVLPQLYSYALHYEPGQKEAFINNVLAEPWMEDVIEEYADIMEDTTVLNSRLGDAFDSVHKDHADAALIDIGDPESGYEI